MKNITLAIAAILALALAPLSGAHAQDRAGARNRAQAARIAEGSQQGQLSPAEQRHLARQQRRVQRTERRAAADGVVTTRERARIERRQDRASRHIYAARHNAR